MHWDFQGFNLLLLLSVSADMAESDNPGVTGLVFFSIFSIQVRIIANRERATALNTADLVDLGD